MNRLRQLRCLLQSHRYQPIRLYSYAAHAYVTYLVCRRCGHEREG